MSAWDCMTRPVARIASESDCLLPHIMQELQRSISIVSGGVIATSDSNHFAIKFAETPL